MYIDYIFEPLVQGRRFLFRILGEGRRHKAHRDRAGQQTGGHSVHGLVLLRWFLRGVDRTLRVSRIAGIAGGAIAFPSSPTTAIRGRAFPHRPTLGLV